MYILYIHDNIINNIEGDIKISIYYTQIVWTRGVCVTYVGWSRSRDDEGDEARGNDPAGVVYRTYYIYI